MRLLTILVLLSCPVVAYAGECASDADCAEGQYCAMMETCAVPACPDGQECEPPVCDRAAGQCVDSGPSSPDYVYGNACEADADCPAGFTCDTVEIPCATDAGCGCSCPPCDPDSGAECLPCDCGECATPDPTPCEPTSATYCAFHPKDCTTDGDCAEGFECVKDEVCYGSGSTGCAVPDCACACEGADCPPCECPTDPTCDAQPEPVEETCEVVGQYCAPKQIACTDASVCPADWECVSVPVYDCACPMIDCPPVEAMCPDMAPDCVEKAKACEQQPACECPAQQPEAYCMPKGWGDVIASQSDASSTGGVEAPTGGAELGDFLSNAQEAAEGPRHVTDKGAVDDTTGGDGNGAAAGTGGDGGCSVGGTGNGLAFLLLALLALVGIDVARRRVSVSSRD